MHGGNLYIYTDPSLKGYMGESLGSSTSLNSSIRILGFPMTGRWFSILATCLITNAVSCRGGSNANP